MCKYVIVISNSIAVVLLSEFRIHYILTGGYGSIWKFIENQNVKTGNLSTILLIIGFRNFRELYQNLTKDQRNKLSKFYGSESLVIMTPYEFKVASILCIYFII